MIGACAMRAGAGRRARASRSARRTASARRDRETRARRAPPARRRVAAIAVALRLAVSISAELAEDPTLGRPLRSAAPPPRSSPSRRARRTCAFPVAGREDHVARREPLDLVDGPEDLERGGSHDARNYARRERTLASSDAGIDTGRRGIDTSTALPFRVTPWSSPHASATLQLAETFVIARGAEDEAEVVQVEVRHGGVSGFGEAAPIERYDESAESALAWLEAASRSATIRSRSTRSSTGLPPGEHAARAARRRALHDLQGKLAGLPVYRLLGLRRIGPPTSWTVWLGDPDDMARRAEKAAARGFQRLKLKLGGRDGLDVERVRAVRARHRPAAAVRRQRVLDARRGARVPPADGARVLRAAAARRRPRRARAEAALADPDLRRRGLPHARRRRARAPSARTASTSSSRSRAGSARRCGWSTPRVRSGSA